MILMVEDSREPYVINEDNPSEGYISMDRVFLPQGVHVTLKEVLNNGVVRRLAANWALMLCSLLGLVANSMASAS